MPAQAAYVGTARIFAAAVARQAGVREEQVEDLKLAISEACAVGVRDEGGGTIVVHAHIDGARVDFEVSGEEIPPPPDGDLISTPESFRRTTGFDIISSLFPDARFSSDETGRIAFGVEIQS